MNSACDLALYICWIFRPCSFLVAINFKQAGGLPVQQAAAAAEPPAPVQQPGMKYLGLRGGSIFCVLPESHVDLILL